MSLDALKPVIETTISALEGNQTLKNLGVGIYYQAPENAQFPYIHVIAIDTRPLSRRHHSASQSVSLTLNIVWRAESIAPGLEIYKNILNALSPIPGSPFTNSGYTLYYRPEFTEHIVLEDGETQMLRVRFRIIATAPCS